MAKISVTLIKDSGASGIWGWGKDKHVCCGMVQVETWHKMGKDREGKLLKRFNLDKSSCVCSSAY